MATPQLSKRQLSRVSDSPNTDTPIPERTVTTLHLPLLTPSRRAVISTPSVNRSATRWTPRARGPSVPTTPHGLRAIQRRAANTPGRERRKSGRVQQETTLNVLRNLGKALAPTSHVIHSSPEDALPPLDGTKDEIEELDNEPDLPRPRLSLPIDDISDESELGGTHEMRPPRLSLPFTDEDITLEYPRRDLSQRDRERLSLMSYAGIRLSENFADLTRIESGSEGENASKEIEQEEAEVPDETIISQGAFERGGETEDLGRFKFDFNFPTPPPPDVGGGHFDEPIDGEGEFELAAMELQLPEGQISSDDEDFAGVGLELNAPRRVSLSESPGLVGGGLRQEQFDKGTAQKQKKISRHGIPVPNLPCSVVKKLAVRFGPTRAGSKTKISKSTLVAIEQASAWFFEQASDDLAAYSKHAGRKTIDESDVATLMRRQRHLNNANTIFSLAQKHLPKELLQDMRPAMPP